MKLDIAEVKTIVLPVRFDPQTMAAIKRLAKKHGTSQGKIVRALIDKALKI